MSDNGPPTPYRAGVIGCGTIGSTMSDDVLDSSARWLLPFGHAACYQQMSRTTLVGGADVEAGRRRAFGKRWGVPTERVYADYRDLLERESLEVVSISTPSPLHAEAAMAAVEAGVKAIFLEKPIASNLADARRVVDACASAGIALSVNHTRRGDHTYRRARRLIDEGVIGHMHSLTAFQSGSLMFGGTHLFDTMNYLVGDTPISWLAGHLDEPAGFDPGGSAYFVYESGVRGFVNASSGSGASFRIHAVGGEGEIVIGNYDLELRRTNPNSRRREPVRHVFPQVIPAVSPMTQLIVELLDAAEGGPVPVSSGETGITALEPVIALHDSSARDGIRVRFRDDLNGELTVPSL